ncbi:hypothetical protein [Escherichia coli]|uniref:hypothetical protein n=1 Tax=Escherichia coli TaxID=562 RepID=UPI00158D04E8|nr:hypothetical protein [Escherichia coli]
MENKIRFFSACLMLLITSTAQASSNYGKKVESLGVDEIRNALQGKIESETSTDDLDAKKPRNKNYGKKVEPLSVDDIKAVLMGDSADNPSK